jgi:hypothetical protein
MGNEGYNGYANYETWNVCLWLDNDQGSYQHWRERAREALDSEGSYRDARYALARELEDDHREYMPEVTGVYADLLGAALSSVDWREVAETRFDEDWEGVEYR